MPSEYIEFARAYRRREPEKHPLYRILVDHLETFC